MPSKWKKADGRSKRAKSRKLRDDCGIVSIVSSSIISFFINDLIFNTPVASCAASCIAFYSVSHSASRVVTLAFSNVFFDDFNNGFGYGSGDGEELDIGDGGNDDLEIGSVGGAVSGVINQDTLGVTDISNDIAAVCMPKEAEVEYISKEVFEEM
ncbi:hypothetical protein BOTCAL_0001g00430 [Botryotinia calthae]|uniref:Uncharacterized protein n=1 Tax=Botryotinia calthae TaxID=38488 RepID=A0A4Y8DI78_9HELO|nr:hypothetical protein BOTCAL_0001g00430 [Botryotinia calthae]